MLERLVGRVWFLAVFVIGALGGSLMSLAINPGNLTSVGASGAIMALFAAMFVLGFRLPSGPLRTRAQVGSTRILIPSLLPLATTTAGAMQIDYGAHFGGALAGAGLGLLLLRTWPATSRLPSFRQTARAIAVIGVLLVGVGGAAAAVRYATYQPLAVMIPADQLPKTTAEIRQQGEALVTRYPDDPRSHMFAGIAALAVQDYHRSEHEMQTAMQEAPRFRTLLDREFSNNASVLWLQPSRRTASINWQWTQRAPHVRHCPPAIFVRKWHSLSQEHLCERLPRRVDGGDDARVACRRRCRRESLVDTLAAHVREVDFVGARPIFAPDMIAFGTFTDFMTGRDIAEQQQWRNVWQHIDEFRFRPDIRALVSPDRLMAVGMALFD